MNTEAPNLEVARHSGLVPSLVSRVPTLHALVRSVHHLAQARKKVSHGTNCSPKRVYRAIRQSCDGCPKPTYNDCRNGG